MSEANPGADPVAIRRRIELLRADVMAAERKRAGIAMAIQSRREALRRLEAQLALGSCAPTPPRHE